MWCADTCAQLSSSARRRAECPYYTGARAAARRKPRSRRWPPAGAAAASGARVGARRGRTKETNEY